jgi:hypothetical protein
LATKVDSIPPSNYATTAAGVVALNIKFHALSYKIVLRKFADNINEFVFGINQKIWSGITGVTFTDQLRSTFCGVPNNLLKGTFFRVYI